MKFMNTFQSFKDLEVTGAFGLILVNNVWPFLQYNPRPKTPWFNINTMVRRGLG